MRTIILILALAFSYSVVAAEAPSPHFVFNWEAKVTDIIMIVAILIGPIAAVCVTVWAQGRNEKRTAKMNLFVALMGARKSNISYQIAAALNTIDVVFADNASIIALWHKYYALLGQSPSEERNHTWLELLHAMAKDLHYSTLSQIDLDRFYIPQGHVDEFEFQAKTRREVLRVLENTSHFLGVPKEEKPTEASKEKPKN